MTRATPVAAPASVWTPAVKRLSGLIAPATANPMFLMELAPCEIQVMFWPANDADADAALTRGSAAMRPATFAACISAWRSGFMPPEWGRDVPVQRGGL